MRPTRGRFANKLGRIAICTTSANFPRSVTLVPPTNPGNHGNKLIFPIEARHAFSEVGML